MEIGALIRQERLAAGIKQRDLAAKVGIPSQNLYAIEIGKRPFPTERYGMLPEPIRSKVIDAAIAELEALR